MAINMLNEDSMVKCSICNSNLLYLNQVYILEKIQTNEGIKYRKVPYKTYWMCANCDAKIPVKDSDVIT